MWLAKSNCKRLYYLFLSPLTAILRQQVGWFGLDGDVKFRYVVIMCNYCSLACVCLHCVMGGGALRELFAILSLTSGITKVLKSFQTTWTSYKIVILICHCLKLAWFCLTTQFYCEVLATAHLKTNNERAGGYKPLKHRPAYKIQDFTANKVETLLIN